MHKKGNQLKEAVRASIPAIFHESDLMAKCKKADEITDKIGDYLEAFDLWEAEGVAVDVNIHELGNGVTIDRFYVEFDGFGVSKTRYYGKEDGRYDFNLIGLDFSIEKDTEADQRKALKRALIVSSNKKGKYSLSNAERERGHYFLFEGLEVPFKVVLNDNSKIKGVEGISFTTAKDCPSKALGLCQLPSESLCYACQGEGRATRRDNEDGSKGMDSYLNGVLCGFFWNIWSESAQVRNDFLDFLIFKEIEVLRFNLKGDFRDASDVAIIYSLAQSFKMVGYTARDDLSEELETLGNHPNCYLNGSNRKYTNHFKATTDLKEFAEASHRCKSGCLVNGCGNCYNLRDSEITVLIHGNGSETALKTWDNCAYLGDLFGVQGYKIEQEKALGLVTCLNKVAGTDFKSTKEALKFKGVI